MTDKRYAVIREYCGHDTPRWVARFCGGWIGESSNRQQAWELCDEHAAERNKAWATR